MAALRPHAFRVRANGMKRHFLHKHSENNLLAGWLWEIMIVLFCFFSTTTMTEQSWWEVNKGFKWHLATWSTLSGTLLLSGGRQQTNVCVLHCSEDKRRHTRRVSLTGSLSAAFMNKSSSFVTVGVTGSAALHPVRFSPANSYWLQTFFHEESIRKTCCNIKKRWRPLLTPLTPHLLWKNNQY